jgi:WD40 repeat protein
MNMLLLNTRLLLLLITISACFNGYTWKSASNSDVNRGLNISPWETACAAWSPDGTWIAVCYEEVILLYTNDLRINYPLYGHENTVTSLSWKPNGSELASGSDDHTVRIWDVQTRKQVSIYRGQMMAITHVRWSPNGKLVASASADETFRSQPSLQIFEPSARAYKYSFDTNLHNAELYQFLSSIAWSPDSQQLAIADQYADVGIWDIQSGRLTSRIPTGYRILDVAWNPDGEQIAVGGGYPGEPGYLGIWDTQTGKLVSELIGHTDWITRVSWSPDGCHIATTSEDQTVKVWDSSSGEISATLFFANSDDWIWPNFVSWNPDSTQIAWTIGKKQICVWAIKSAPKADCVDLAAQQILFNANWRPQPTDEI